MSTKKLKLTDLHIDPANVRKHPERNLKTIQASLARFKPARSIVIDADNVVRAGNGTVEGALAEGLTDVLVVEPQPGQIVAVRRKDWSPTEATAYSIADNRTAELAEWDDEPLAAVLAALQAEDIDIESLGFTQEELDQLIADTTGTDVLPGDRPKLTDRFLIPPFSVLDARQGYWQDRKRAWLALGIQSELGRGGG